MALSNLLSNAIRFSPSGGQVRWWIGTQGDHAVLQISDSGPGVPPAERDHIFDPFYRGSLQPPDQPRSSGIGLAIVREQVAAHGGRVKLLADGDNDAAGACFQILLPLNPLHPTDTAHA